MRAGPRLAGRLDVTRMDGRRRARSGEEVEVSIRRLLAAAVVLTGLVSPLTPVVAAGKGPRTIPRPTVIGPVSGGHQDHPFAAMPREPGMSGYVESEYFIKGKAAAYDASPDALVATRPAPPPPGQVPYETRMLVRRPSDPARFNGTVVVEWLNDTSGYDVDAAWADMRHEIVRGGFAYVAVTAQLVGVTGLKAWDPTRYRPLVHPGDAYAYDIYSQAIQAVRNPGSKPPLGPLRVRHVIATGDSQSGTALNHYINNVQPRVRPVVDGFLVITAADKVHGNRVPVMQILTEEEVARAAEQKSTPLFRQWQIAGASHSDKNQGDYLRQTQNRDFDMPRTVNWPLTPADVPIPNGGDCLMGRFPKYLAEHAALEEMNSWIAGGPPPPRAPRIKVRNAQIVRDHNGNAKKGLRLPDIDVPIAAYYGDATNECAFTLGRTKPFGLVTLYRIYPSHTGYVHLVQQAAAASVRAGYLLPDDAHHLVVVARRSFIGE
jgi:hypothetical protein